MLSLLVFSLGVSIPLSVFAGTPNKADYPPMDKLAPANAAWGSNVLSNVPSIPVGTVPLTVTDWSKDVTTCPQQNQWGLTYDDGPGPLTDDLLGELAKRKTTATFFVIGSRVLERPDVLLRTYQAGHHIGIHTWSHPYLSTVSNEQIIAEITYTIMAVKTVIGVTPAFVRPPYGDIDDRVRTVLTNLGLTIVEWNVDPQDTAARGDVAQQFATKANAGSAGVISLEHDMFQTTEPQAAAALDAIMAGSGGYKPMPVAECLGKNPYDEGFWTKLGISAPDGNSTIIPSETATTVLAEPSVVLAESSTVSTEPSAVSSEPTIYDGYPQTSTSESSGSIYDQPDSSTNSDDSNDDDSNDNSNDDSNDDSNDEKRKGHSRGHHGRKGRYGDESAQTWSSSPKQTWESSNESTQTWESSNESTSTWESSNQSTQTWSSSFSSPTDANSSIPPTVASLPQAPSVTNETIAPSTETSAGKSPMENIPSGVLIPSNQIGGSSNNSAPILSSASSFSRFAALTIAAISTGLTYTLIL